MTQPENTPAPKADDSASGAVVVSEKHYHGKPCRNCGRTLRYRKGGQCVVCWCARTRAHRAANREEIRAYDRARRAANREKYAARDRAYRESNREAILARARERYYGLDHVTYYERQLKARRRKALKAKEKRHGPLSDEG